MQHHFHVPNIMMPTPEVLGAQVPHSTVPGACFCFFLPCILSFLCKTLSIIKTDNCWDCTELWILANSANHSFKMWVGDHECAVYTVLIENLIGLLWCTENISSTSSPPGMCSRPKALRKMCTFSKSVLVCVYGCMMSHVVISTFSFDVSASDIF